VFLLGLIPGHLLSSYIGADEHSEIDSTRKEASLGD